MRRVAARDILLRGEARLNPFHARGQSLLFQRPHDHFGATRRFRVTGRGYMVEVLIRINQTRFESFAHILAHAGFCALGFYTLSRKKGAMSTLSASQVLGLAFSYVRTWTGLLWKMEAQLKGADLAGAARFEGRPIISLCRGSKMRFGKQISLNSATRSNPLGCFQPCV